MFNVFFLITRSNRLDTESVFFGCTVGVGACLCVSGRGLLCDFLCRCRTMLYVGTFMSSGGSFPC